MKNQFTKDEIEANLACELDSHDIVRLVDPELRHVCFADGTSNGAYACSGILGHSDRCENCCSLRALETKGKAFKLDLANGMTYWVYSRYVTVEGKPRVIETVDNVTNSILFESANADEIGKIIEKYNHLVINDALTNVYNRRFLDYDFLPSFRFCTDKNLIVNVAMIDVDGFKSVNDTYGHQAGDAVLKKVAKYWKKYFNSRVVGADRVVCRYGGDEFVIITCGEKAEDFAEELKKRAGGMPTHVIYGKTEIKFSITYGLASGVAGKENSSLANLIHQADEAFYAAKGER
jgi:putative two-component system response regulator